MPLAPTGVPDFALAHPTYDGRGVLIAILDSGIDPTIPGLGLTSTGDRKILDLRDFSGEGSVALAKLTPRGDTVVIAGHPLGGFSHVRSMDADGPWYGGSIAEINLGDPEAADLNADGDVNDTLLVVVTRASDGWVLFADTKGDGSLTDDRAVHDYLVARETFGWAPAGGTPYVNIAVNFADANGQPTLDLLFDTSAHGSHVAGIAAGHDLYGVKGFDGVAPGAQLLGLKIADDAQGGISRTGSMIRALDYAIRFAEARQMPLVVNMSFGVGNEIEGQARIDHLIDSTLAAHPGVVFTISAGNDGPGLSTLGFPGSAARIISVGALFPGVFLAGDGAMVPANGIADFSARGGEMSGPDLIAPGVAYSTVPLWDRGGEREGGTSMASPHAAGLAARLYSGARQEGKSPTAWTIRQALMVTAQPLDGATFVDEGTGLPNLPRAWAWLRGRSDVPYISVSTPAGTTAAFVDGGPGGTSAAQRFVLRRDGWKDDVTPLPQQCTMARRTGHRDTGCRPGHRRREAPPRVACQAGRLRRRDHGLGHGHAGGAAGAARDHGGGAVPRQRHRAEAAQGADGPVGAGAVRGRFGTTVLGAGLLRRRRRHRSRTCSSRVACRTGTTTRDPPAMATVRRCSTCWAGMRWRATTSWWCRPHSSRQPASMCPSSSPRCGWDWRARRPGSRRRCRTSRTTACVPTWAPQWWVRGGWRRYGRRAARDATWRWRSRHGPEASRWT
jgi:subtilisin family serine protease